MQYANIILFLDFILVRDKNIIIRILTNYKDANLLIY